MDIFRKNYKNLLSWLSYSYISMPYMPCLAANPQHDNFQLVTAVAILCSTLLPLQLPILMVMVMMLLLFFASQPFANRQLWRPEVCPHFEAKHNIKRIFFTVWFVSFVQFILTLLQWWLQVSRVRRKEAELNWWQVETEVWRRPTWAHGSQQEDCL